MEVDSIEEWEDFEGEKEIAVMPLFVCSPGISAAAMQYESSSENRSERVSSNTDNLLKTHNRKHYSSIASSLGPEHYGKPSDQYKPKWRRTKHCEIQSCFCQKTYFFKIPRSDNFRIVARRNDYVHALGCFINCFPKVMNNEKICFTIPDEEISEVYNHTPIEELRNFCDEAADYCKDHTDHTSYVCFKYLNRFMMLFLYGAIAVTVIAVLTFLNDMTQLYFLVGSGGGSLLLFVIICIFHKCINTRTKRFERSLKKFIEENRKKLEERKVRPIAGMYGYWIEFRVMLPLANAESKPKINVENLGAHVENEKRDIEEVKVEEKSEEKDREDIEEEKEEVLENKERGSRKAVKNSLEDLRNQSDRLKMAYVSSEQPVKKSKETPQISKVSSKHAKEPSKQSMLSTKQSHRSSINSKQSSKQYKHSSKHAARSKKPKEPNIKEYNKENIPATNPSVLTSKPSSRPSPPAKPEFKAPQSKLSSHSKADLRLGTISTSQPKDQKLKHGKDVH
jgi:hypothetical protein